METNVDNIITNALDLINEEDFEGAKSLLNLAIEVEPDNADHYKNLGLCEVNLDNNDNAIDAFKKAYEINPTDATTVYYYACCISKKDKNKAIGLFKEVINLRSEYTDAYKSLAMAYIEIGQIDLAIDTALDVINSSEMENDYSIFYIAATGYMLKKDYLNAVKYLLGALEFKPDHLPVLNSLSICYMNLQEYSKAKDILEKAYKLDSKNSLTAYNLGICNQMSEDYKTALKFFQEAYNASPTPSMLSSLAFCALKSGDVQLASVLYKNLVDTYPNNTEYRFSYSEALEGIENFEDALKNVEFLLSLDEKNVTLIKKKGTYLRRLRRNEESNEVFLQLVNRGKIDIEVYYNLAFNYAQLADYDNAKEMFKKCTILEPNNPYAHKDLGVLYLKMNCYDWALDEMKQAVELENDVAEFHYSLGVSYMMLSNISEAKNAFLDAIKLDSNYADALAYLGYVYMLESDFDNAIKTLQKALEIDPDNFLARSHAAKYYFHLKKYETAKELLSDILEKTHDDETMNMLAFCYMQLGENQNAVGLYHKLAHKYPQNQSILINLAKCEKLCNMKKEALEHVRKALLIYEDNKEALDLLKELQND